MSIALLERENAVSELVKNALEPEVWINHLKNDLMKFWDKPAAYELQDGLFPTYRSNSGERIDPNNLPDELLQTITLPDLWKSIIILYVRIQGRLTHMESPSI